MSFKCRECDFGTEGGCNHPEILYSQPILLMNHTNKSKLFLISLISLMHVPDLPILITTNYT